MKKLRSNRINRGLLVGFLAILLCAQISCAHSPEQINSYSSSEKLTPEADSREIYLGSPLPEKISLSAVSLLSQCFLKNDLKQNETPKFMLKIAGSEFQVVQGELWNIEELVACLNSQKDFKWSSFEGHWLWTADFKIPKVVGKNWLKLPSAPLNIQQKPGTAE